VSGKTRYSRYNSRRAAAIEDQAGRTFLYTLGALMALITEDGPERDFSFLFGTGGQSPN
jgi:hypothetical protein